MAPFGLWAATVGAVFSTSSAINETLFSTTRLIRDVSAAGELPARLSRERRELPAEALFWIATLGAAFSLLPGITEIVSFGSLTFLLVFGLINLLHARHTAARGPDRGLAYVGAAACIAAAGGLLYYLARSDRPALALIGAPARRSSPSREQHSSSRASVRRAANRAMTMRARPRLRRAMGPAMRMPRRGPEPETHHPFALASPRPAARPVTARGLDRRRTDTWRTTTLRRELLAPGAGGPG